MPLYLLETRKQPVKKGSSQFGGPDTYVCVQVVPDGITPLIQLNQTIAGKRGIALYFFGEGYAAHDGPDSKLGKALAAAQRFIDEHTIVS